MFPNLFTPHGMCLLWDPGLISLSVISDSMIALAYFTIPLALFLFLRRVGRIVWLNPLFSRVIYSFVAFICLCGLTHVFDVIVIWYPWYWTHAWIKAATAIASVLTAVTIFPLLPLIRFEANGLTLERRRARSVGHLSRLAGRRKEDHDPPSPAA